jgi:acyl carrier protein
MKRQPAKDIKNWDSLAQVALIISIERKFKIKFSVKEVDNLKNIGDMMKLIQLLKKIKNEIFKL